MLELTKSNPNFRSDPISIQSHARTSAVEMGWSSFRRTSAELFSSATLCYSAELRYYSASFFCHVQRRT